MFLSMDGAGPWTALYYVALVLLGSFFLMNLLIAILKNKFSAASTSRAKPAPRSLRRALLNATGQSRVTLSLRYEHLRAVCG